MNLVWRLIRSQLGRHKSAVVARIAIAAVIAATPYGFSFLGKWLVDEALEVTRPTPVAASAQPTEQRPEGEAEMGLEWKAKTPEAKLRLLGIFLGVSLGIHVATTALGALSELLNSRTVHEMVYDLRTKLHDKLSSADMAFFSGEQVGQLMTRVLDDAAGIPGNLANLVINSCTQVLMLILGLVLLIRLNPSMTVVPLIALPFYAVACWCYLPRLRRNTEDIRTSAAEMNGYVVERLTNVLTIKNYAQEDQEISRFGGFVDRQLGLGRRQHRLNLGFNTSTTLITAVANLSVLAIGFLFLKEQRMQLGEVLAFHQVTAQLFVPISALVGMTTVTQTIQVLAERVFSVLDAESSVAEADDPIRLPAIRGGVAFSDVSLRYQAGGPFAVREVSLTIPSGKVVCLVGPTGCGKSTLIALMTRLYDPTRGKLTLDGVDLRDIPLRRLRRSVGNVLSTSQVFTGTFRENLAYGAPKATEEQIRDAASLVELDSFITELPEGYDTLLGRGGLPLESEELAKLNLARALVANPAILTVDDTYATFPEELERRLRAAIRSHLIDKTIVIATSRLSICEDADIVVVMQKGQIAQSGSHAELLSVPGLYRRMYMRQMGLSGRDDGGRTKDEVN